MKNMCRWLQIIQLKKIGLGFVLGCGVTVPAFADDIEIYTDANLSGPAAQPNIMFVMDSSLNMEAELDEPLGYEYGHVPAYVGGYDVNRIYYTEDGSVPGVNGKYFFWSANQCDHSLRLYDEFGVRGGAETGSLYTTGKYFGQIAQYKESSNVRNKVWRPLTTNNNTTRAYTIECKQDQGVHGNNTGASNHIVNGESSPWSTSDTGVADALWPNNGANYYYLYTGDYLNYTVDPAVVGGAAPTASVPLFDQLKNAIGTLVASATNINIGLMQYDGTWELIDGKDVGAQGGAVMYPVLDVNAPAGDFFPRLTTMQSSDPNHVNDAGDPDPFGLGDSPIAETYYEALQYFGGKAIVYGNESSPSNQRGSKEIGNPGFYQTPITETCQKNYIIMVSNGLSSYDYIDKTKRATMPGEEVIGQCNTNDYTGGSYNDNYYDLTDADTMAASSEASTVDNCLDEMAAWALNNDVATRADVAAHEGEQNITTYTVGFAIGDAGSDQHRSAEQLLRDTAEKGGGRFIEASNQAELERGLGDLVAEILKVNSTFSSPAVSVNAFNRATNLDDLFFTLFKPTEGEHWEGNLKKFKLEFDADGIPFVADKNSNNAIDITTGFFKDSSVSYWTESADSPDGAETAKGGAAGKLQNIVDGRRVVTFTGTYSNTSGVLTPSNGDLTATANKLDFTNANITDVMLGNAAANHPTIPTYKAFLLLWAAGLDVKDFDEDGLQIDARREMGDPLHAEPALVQYGLTGDDEPDLVGYVATNDGYLHAFSAVTGEEHFAFVPQEQLPKLQNIYDDTGINGKAYGLDGNVVPWIHDANNDGTISGGSEHVYLYFGMRRGGRYIYSMDVTDRTSPKLRWVIEGGVGDFAELGETWSAPNVEKVKINGIEKTVLIFGAGYDTNQDNVITRTVDSVGRGVYIVDADSGRLLWQAGPVGSGADLQLADMEYSIPARIKPIDIDSDGFTDRLYIGDMGGQLWRIDIDNAGTSSRLSATGGRIADLAIDADVTQNRRFYNPPDAALILEPGLAPYLAIVATSGYRAHPLQTDTQDRAYMIRDYDVYTIPASYTVTVEADLFDTTDNIIGQGTVSEVNVARSDLNGKKGWYISFHESNGDYVGEKALSEPLILNNIAIFTTYIPAAAGLRANSCKANDGNGRLYFVNITNGTPTNDNDGDPTNDCITAECRSELLARGGIPPTPRVIITEDGIPTLCTGTECIKSSELGNIQKIYWYEVEE